ncbi:Activating signal cointegrator 1 complex subunit 1 [Echinococcus granulosus]|uniref:Activating signal cointegrator 1 complex subunit n=2 Tax=Echinococcus granulosus TaxID=6210 RepID=A0A068WET8_ECHGR|nr:Activating signal cointegrator 1 complex subunit 1 [Echinococcus granulosus]CDS18614.1 Activating signal cointegrator 1 complex subunit [Echinococcus granulosus]
MDSFVMDRTADILSPPLIKIDDKLYRKNPIKSTSCTMVPVGRLETDFEPVEEPVNNDFDSDQTCHIMEEIKSDFGGYVAKFSVPPIFYSRIVGVKQIRRHELESQFHCRLDIPGPQSSLSYIKIFAKSVANIHNVARRISWIVAESRPKMKPTHLVCLPVISNAIKESYLAFKKDILEHVENDKEGSFRGIDGDLFVSQHKLHFTLATLFLADQKEVRLASQLLTSFLDQTDEGRAFDRSPLCLTIRGIDCMNDDPRSARVLYMSLKENVQSCRLQTLANGLADMFTRRGLHSGCRRVGDPVKLHMTVLNSRLRAQRQALRLAAETNGLALSSQCSSESFSTMGILLAFETHHLIENGRFEEVQLCKMIADDAEDDDGSGFYPCVAKLILSYT